MTKLPAACPGLAMPAAGKPLSSLPCRAVPSGLNSAEKELVYMEETDAWRRLLELEHTGLVLYPVAE